MKVLVLGAGVAGLTTALALARSDHEVILLERDIPSPPGRAGDAPAWERPGIPHFLQPHAFLARGTKELRVNAPDVYQALVDVGADELRLIDKMPPSPPEDEDDYLRFLGCRRPVIEWVLRHIVSKEPNVSLRSGVATLGLEWARRGSEVPHATGALTPEGPVSADLVVDAMGRSSQLSDWIVDGGGFEPEMEGDDCGIVYYSRYFRFRRGHGRPDGPWLLGPRAELGYLETGTFWGDNDTFAMVQQIKADDRQLRVLRHPDKWMASLRSQPIFKTIVDEEVSEPITPVLPMGQLRNTLRRFVADGRPIASGVVAIGDSLCHTNPRYAWGLSLSILQGFVLADLVERHGKDSESLATAFDAAVHPWARAAFDVATATDNERKRYWSGEPIDFTTPSDGLQLFLLMILPMAGNKDAVIFRKAVRRLMLLDNPQDIEKDLELLERGADLVEGIMASASPRPQGPPRDELIELVRAGASE